ncbi:Uncharacterized protein ToN1_06800 [Aromatoleum petrolei]|nr:Uncharacterized protein ToN1_06800 [Aromatoleum petrolei]
MNRLRPKPASSRVRAAWNNGSGPTFRPRRIIPYCLLAHLML